MTLSEFAPAAPPRIRIDTVFLLRHVSTLSQVRQKRRTWNEFGEKVFDDFKKSSAVRRQLASWAGPAAASEATYWSMAKELIYVVVAGQDPRHDGIRERLGNLQEPSTARLWTTLNLWLAGELGISTSVTGPLIAVMLYGVAEASGDWEVLRDSRKR
jgi:hypothetical protein